MKKILIVDDNVDLCFLLSNFLKKNGFKTDEVYDGKGAVKLAIKNNYDLVLSDFRLPDIDGLQVLQEIKKINHCIPIIIMTAYSDIKMAVKLIKSGAYNYLAKPLNHEEILRTINQALEPKEKIEVALKEEPEGQNDEYPMGQSKESKILYRQIELVAPTDLTVIIEGESGTGKEVVANLAHKKSKRKDKPFIALDCGAIPNELAGSELFGHEKGAFTGAVECKTGVFEMANGGTLLLDEVANLPIRTQMTLLRVLQEKKMRRIGGNQNINLNVRVIVATNESLTNAIEEGKFREDLFHRLNEYKILVPTLKQREKDILFFAKHFLKLSNIELNKQIKGFSKEVEEYFNKYSWPGNIREMKNIIRRAVLLTDPQIIEVDALPIELTTDSGTFITSHSRSDDTPPDTDLKSSSEKAERETIIKVLQQVNFNKTKAAKILKIDRKTLYNKIAAYDILSKK